MEIVVLIIGCILYWWYNNYKKERYMNEIKTGHIEHTSANNADELYKEIISHDGSINRVRAF